MKRALFAVVLSLSMVAFGQEIGTEINNIGPSATTNTNNTSGGDQNANTNGGNANANANSGGSSTYKPKAKEGAKFEGTKAAASGGDFGIRAGFGASGSTSLPTGPAAAATVAAPAVGIAFMASDSFKLLIDVGFGLGIVGAGAFFALSTNIGFDYLFRTPGDALRPFFHFAGNFNLAGSNTVGIGFGAQLGFGAEYFMSPSFSFNGRLMLAVPMAVFGAGITLGIFTVTPGVGATWYF